MLDYGTGESIWLTDSQARELDAQLTELDAERDERAKREQARFEELAGQTTLTLDLFGHPELLDLSDLHPEPDLFALAQAVGGDVGRQETLPLGTS